MYNIYNIYNIYIYVYNIYDIYMFTQQSLEWKKLNKTLKFTIPWYLLDKMTSVWS